MGLSRRLFTKEFNLTALQRLAIGASVSQSQTWAAGAATV
jgi:hypothetical protein